MQKMTHEQARRDAEFLSTFTDDADRNWRYEVVIDNEHEAHIAVYDGKTGEFLGDVD